MPSVELRGAAPRPMIGKRLPVFIQVPTASVSRAPQGKIAPAASAFSMTVGGSVRANARQQPIVHQAGLAIGSREAGSASHPRLALDAPSHRIAIQLAPPPCSLLLR